MRSKITNINVSLYIYMFTYVCRYISSFFFCVRVGKVSPRPQNDQGTCICIYMYVPWALVGPPGRVRAGPLWASLGPCGPPGPLWAGPLRASLGPYGPRHRDSLLGLTLKTKLTPPQYIFRYHICMYIDIYIYILQTLYTPMYIMSMYIYICTCH